MQGWIDNEILLANGCQALCRHLGHGGGVEDGGGGGAQAHVHLRRGHVLDTCRDVEICRARTRVIHVLSVTWTLVSSWVAGSCSRPGVTALQLSRAPAVTVKSGCDGPVCPSLVLVQSVCPVSPSSSLVTVISSLEVAVVVRLECSVTLTRPDTVLLPAPSSYLNILCRY